MASGVQFSYDDVPSLPGDLAQPRKLPARAVDGVPMFTLKPVRCRDGTYKNVEYVDIIVPGDGKSSPCHKVTDGIRRKYAAYYDHWRRGLEIAPTGVPLEMWPLMTPATVRTLKAQNIFTVEQLSEVSDSALHNVPMGETLRRQAREWLKAKNESDAIEQTVHEKEAALRANKLLEKQLLDLSDRLATMERERAVTADAEGEIDELANIDPDSPLPPRRGPGRPRKE